MPTPPDSFAALYLREVGEIVRSIDPAAVDELADALADVRRRQGRLFILGVGGGAAHASHAVNDFRKLCDFEAYAPTDNVAELTARTNDEGWETSFDAWLRTSRLSSRDAILVFSVGGGSREHNVSVNLVRAIELAQRGRRTRLRRRRSGRRRRRGGGRRLHRRRRTAGAAHAPRRGVPGDRVASPRLASRARHGAREVGVGRGSRRPGERRAPSSSTATGSSSSSSGTPWTGRSRAPTSRRTFGSSPVRPTRSVVSGPSITVRSLSRTNRARRRERLRMKTSAGPTSASFDCSPRRGVAIDDYRYCLHHPDAVDPELAEHANAGSRSRECCSRLPPLSTSTSPVAG